MLSESGMYSLALHSRKPEARLSKKCLCQTKTVHQ